MAIFGKRKRPPKKKVIDRSKHVKALVGRWETTKFFQGVKRKPK